MPNTKLMRSLRFKTIPLIAIATGLLLSPTALGVPLQCGDDGLGWFSALFKQTLRPTWNQPTQGVEETFLPPAPEGKGPIEFSLSERHIEEDFLDYLEIEVSGLSLGQSLRLERFLVDNNQGIVNDKAVLLDSRVLTDGYLPLTGAEPNYNETLDYIEVDLEAVTFRDGEIYSYFPIRSGFESIPGEYVYRVSSPTGGFESRDKRLTIHPTDTEQSYTGRVMNGEIPIAGAWVGLLQPVGNGEYAHLRKVAVSDAGGNYTLYAPFADEFDLVAVAPGYVGPFSIGTGETIEEGQVIEHDLELTRGTRTLSGRIVDSEIGEAIPGLPVTLLSSSAEGQPDGERFTHTWTDANGNFSAIVTPGIWGVTFKPSDVSSRSYLTGLYRAVATVDVSDSDATDVIVPLTRGTCLITGTLSSAVETDEDGEPLPLEGVEVFAFSQEHGWAASGVTYEDGWFNLAVSPGHWTVFPFSYDLEVSHHPGSTSQDVYFTATDQSIELDIEARPIGGVLEGTVTDEESAPIGRLRMTAYNTEFEKLESVVQTTFDSDGSFNFFLGVGNWSIFPDAGAAAERHLLFTDLPRVEISAEGDAFENNAISLPIRTEKPTGTLTWKVQDTADRPIPNIKLHAMMSTPTGRVYDAFGRTNNEGIAHMPVINGEWKIHASIADLHSFQKQELPIIEVTVTGDQTTVQQTANDFTDSLASLNPVQSDDEPGFYVMGRGEPGRQYLVEGSHDLTEWLTLGQVTAVEGEFSIQDYSGGPSMDGDSDSQSAFYRVVPLK